MKAKVIFKKLLKAGFEVARTNGSHRIIVRGKVKYSFAYHDKKELQKGEIKRLEKYTGVKII